MVKNIKYYKIIVIISILDNTICMYVQDITSEIRKNANHI